MPKNENNYQQADEAVQYIVRRQVARKALHDIHQQVDEIEQQITSEKRNARYLLPLILIVLVVLLFFRVDVAQISRVFAGWF